MFLRLIGNPEDDLTNLNNSDLNVHVYDARSFTAAMGNRILGGGTEHNFYYGNCDVSFKNIENIHSVRDSYAKMANLCLK